MIKSSKGEPSVYKGDYRPLTLYKNAKTVSGFKSGGLLEQCGVVADTYNDVITLFGKSDYRSSPNLCPNIKKMEDSYVDGEDEYNWSVTPNSDGTFNFSGAMVTGATAGQVVLSAGTYTASGCDLIQLWCQGWDDFRTLPATFTLDKEETVFLVMWYLNKENLELKNQYIQIEAGDTATKFSPYCGNPQKPPSPDNVRPLAASKGRVNTWGKNLADVSKAVNPCFFKNNDGSYTLQRISESPLRFAGAVPLELPSNTTVKITFNLLVHNLTVQSNGSVQMLINYKDGTTDIFSVYSGRVLEFSKAVYKFILYLEAEEEVGNYITFKDFQIELGDTATEYHPYFGSDSINAPELLGMEVNPKAPYNHTETVNGVTKYYVVDSFENSFITRRIGKLVLDGSEAWWVYKAGDNASDEREFVLNFSDKNATGNTDHTCLCSHFKGVTRSEIWRLAIGISVSQGYVRVSHGYDSIFGGDVNAFKQFLADQYAAGTPVTVYYILKEPTLEQSFTIEGVTGGRVIPNVINSYPRATTICITPKEGCPAYGLAKAVKVVDNH